MIQYLVRHGQSVANVEERVQGQEDVPLSALGRQQAAAVAAWARVLHAHQPCAEVWSSPLVRASETAAAIAAAIDRPVLLTDDLKELNAGIFQGQLWAELARSFPAEFSRWQSGDADYQIPGGESRSGLAARGRGALEVLSRRNVPSMIIVAHGGILTAGLGSLLGPSNPTLAAAALRPFTNLPALANASVSVLEWPGPVLRLFNSTDHLRLP